MELDQSQVVGLRAVGEHQVGPNQVPVKCGTCGATRGLTILTDGGRA